MTELIDSRGRIMAAEIAEAPEVFLRAATACQKGALAGLALVELNAIYTIARGSSDAAANVIAYEAMRELQIPVTSLPPSVFSVGDGVRLEGAGVWLISQSGASEDLVLCAKSVLALKRPLVAITNTPHSAVEALADVTIPIAAGPELAVPATKTVIGSIGAGISILCALSEEYAERTIGSVESFRCAVVRNHPLQDALRAGLLRHQHIYVVGRDVGLGIAQELALKIKETCAIQAEAYSSSEVLHGPLQLATRSMLVLMVDTGQSLYQESLDIAEKRFSEAGVTVLRMRTAEVSDAYMTPITAAALLLHIVYSVIQQVSLALGHDPDSPSTLKKVTTTR